MPFEVFSTFTRCSELHSPHLSLKGAAKCLAEISGPAEGDRLVHPITGKYIHAIAAVDRNGNQRSFQKSEQQLAADLGIDPKSILTHKHAVTNITNLGSLYCEALGSLPMLTVNLDGFIRVRGQEHPLLEHGCGQRPMSCLHTAGGVHLGTVPQSHSRSGWTFSRNFK